jgi:hypothetical protein
MADGATQPVVLTCVDTRSGEQGDYVVKLSDSNRMKEDGQMREVLASFMAMQMDIPTPLPAVVQVDPELVDAAWGREIYGRLKGSQGINFGSGLLSEAPELPLFMPLNDKQKRDAPLVLGFDALIRNFDRRAEKPNLLSDGDHLYVIDHELAFGFAFEIFPNKTPWVLSEADLKLLPNHLLYTKVRSSAFHVEDHVERLERLDERFWDKAWDQLPLTWRHEQYNRIRTDMLAVRAHAREFYEQLKHHLP